MGFRARRSRDREEGFRPSRRKERGGREDTVGDIIVIYRILQEAMNNIGKHSKANAVVLSLRKSAGSIELAIRDNGQGFDPSEAHSHSGKGRGLGLDSMRERVELSGGSYVIDSTRAAGTAIRAFWSVRNGAPMS